MKLHIECTPEDARRVLWGAIGIELLLVAAYLVLFVFDLLSLGPIALLFELDSDYALPVWFSTIQLFVVGSLLLMMAATNQRPDQLSTAFLTVVGLGFLFLSADEAAAIHERITLLMKKLGADALLIRGHGGWISVYVLVGIAGAVAVRKHLWRAWTQFPRESRIAALGAGVYVGGGIGVEVLSYLFLRDDVARIFYRLGVAAEEFLEMSGISLILYAVLLLIHRRSRSPRAGRTVEESRGSPRPTA